MSYMPRRVCCAERLSKHTYRYSYLLTAQFAEVKVVQKITKKVTPYKNVCYICVVDFGIMRLRNYCDRYQDKL